MSGMATAQGWTRHWLVAEVPEKEKNWTAGIRRVDMPNCRHAKRVVPVDMPKQDCLCRHAKKIVVSVHMQKRLSPSTCKNVPVDMPEEIVSVDMPKRLFPSTCQTRLSPSTCKKDCSCRRAKKDCLRRHAKKIVPVDMQKIVTVDMPTQWSSICQNQGVRRHAKIRRQHPWSCLRRHAKGFCPSICQGVLFVRPQTKPPPRMAESFVNKSVSHLCPHRQELRPSKKLISKIIFSDVSSSRNMLPTQVYSAEIG